MLLAESG